MSKEIYNISPLLRRSGIAVCLVSEFLRFKPTYVYQAGIGMNHHEIAVMKLAWPDAKLFGWEPNPEVWPTLEDYWGTWFPQGLSDQTQKSFLNVPKGHRDAGSLYSYDEDRKCQRYEVELITLDQAVPEGPPDRDSLLWLDCEGHELQVLYGASNFIKNIVMVNVELTSDPLSSEWSKPIEVHKYLLELGFVRQHVHTHRLGAGQCDVIYVRPRIFKPEFCCCPCSLEACDSKHG